VEFVEWEPVYEAVLADMGFDRAGDERARDRLAALTSPFEHDRLPAFAGATVAVAGAGPSLPAEVDRAAAADVVVAASTAADVLREAGVALDLVTTDLDKHAETVRTLTREGTPVAVHAHGDNLPLVEEWVPQCDGEWLLPTTQAAPVGPVENFGGFTDGDRAAFLADHFGAGRFVWPGWDLDDPDVSGVKRAKLDWAERLLHWLETRRGERFPVLDGRRDGIEPVV